MIMRNVKTTFTTIKDCSIVFGLTSPYIIRLKLWMIEMLKCSVLAYISIVQMRTDVLIRYIVPANMRITLEVLPICLEL